MKKKTVFILFAMWYLLSANTTFAYTHADTLRGSDGRGRDWWNVLKYYLDVAFDTSSKSISGSVIIDFRIARQMPGDSMQIDLQEPLVIDSVFQRYGGTTILQPLVFKREGNAYWVYDTLFRFHNWQYTERRSIKIFYHGKPREAVNPPWDGGVSWKHDSMGRQWIAVSCQGLGASAWWPCKDAQWDEPDWGMDMHFSMQGNYQVVSNGRLKKTYMEPNGKGYDWHVENPINNYDATFYIGDYVHWQDTLMGEKGKLDLDFWVLKYNEERARNEFAVVKQMIHCYEYWLGPYPFYEDGYKLVEAPYLGMEHQSAIAYGNKFQMGYLGTDRSTSGLGMNFDYIIIHESGHEWFGNSVTAKDIADNWIHEGITTYSESLFAECLLGKEDGQKYCKGEWHNILNNRPIIGDYGVNKEGSPDMYDKGAAIMYMIRTMTNNDEKFRQMLRGLSKEFYHKNVTTNEVETFIAKKTGLNLTGFFNQYLRTADIPELEYYLKNDTLSYRFNNVVEGFTMPLTIKGRKKKTATINPSAAWQRTEWTGGYNVKFPDDFLIKVK
jgi:aminopeptidase N